MRSMRSSRAKLVNHSNRCKALRTGMVMQFNGDANVQMLWLDGTRNGCEGMEGLGT
jgi:hypothetical protein